MRHILFATAFTAALGTAAPTFVHAAPSTEPPAQTATTRQAAPAARSAETPDAPQGDEARYAAQEAANPDAANFTGGANVVIIGASTATVVLAIILLLVLL